MGKQTGIDIIIPIYNAYEDLVKCVSSVWKYTDLTKNRLILIDDCSPDERIDEYLNRIQGGNIIVHKNACNVGFSASVNLGIDQSLERDVTLLNSDTIVTEKWIDKILQCAYSEDTIATVTPLSNSATIASIPIIGQDNKIPEHVSIDEYAHIVERCSFKRYPPITVAVGFCMFIKRSVLNEIGNFDAKTFGKGYGEENDFCCRAEIMGYKHVLCDDTFIYHKGTASFIGKEKQKLIEDHVRILEERYAASMFNNHLFCLEKPYQYIRDNIVSYLRLTNKKHNIMYILHYDFREEVADTIGGTQLHVRDLKTFLVKYFNIYVLIKYKKYFSLICYIDDNIYTYKFDDDNVNAYPIFRDEKRNKLIKNIISAFEINLIHVHHLSKMSLEVYYAAKMLDVPVITTIHDFYLVCPTMFLCNAENTFCNGTISNGCAKCVSKRLTIGIGEEYLSKWRREIGKAINLSDLIIYPSNSARRMFTSVYDALPDSKVIYHGVSLEAEDAEWIPAKEAPAVITNLENLDLVDNNLIAGWCIIEEYDSRNNKIIVQLLHDGKVLQEVVAIKTIRQDVDDYYHGCGKYKFSGFQARIFKQNIDYGKIDVRILVVDNHTAYTAKIMSDILMQKEKVGTGTRIAFLGGMSAIKGSQTAYEMISSSLLELQWFIFGDISPEEKLFEYKSDNLHKYGGYNRKDIIKILRGYEIDLVCILSAAAETFSYTLSESIAAGIPVLAYDIGALGERINAMKGGWILPYKASSDFILNKIDMIIKNGELSAGKKRVQSIKQKNASQMAVEYKEIYDEYIRRGGYEDFDAELIFRSVCKDDNVYETELTLNVGGTIND